MISQAQRAKHLQSKNLAIAIWHPCPSFPLFLFPFCLPKDLSSGSSGPLQGGIAGSAYSCLRLKQTQNVFDGARVQDNSKDIFWHLLSGAILLTIFHRLFGCAAKLITGTFNLKLNTATEQTLHSVRNQSRIRHLYSVLYAVSTKEEKWLAPTSILVPSPCSR